MPKDQDYTDEDLADVCDNPVWTPEMIARARPLEEVIPELAEAIQKGRGKQKAPTKSRVTIRLDQNVIDKYKDAGPGWQTRMAADLKKAAGL